MKKILVLIALIILSAVMLFAEGREYFGSPEGQWTMIGSRLFQKDTSAPRAKAWMEVSQKDSMVYEFTIRYEGGAEDGHGGVGIHILCDSPARHKAWGFGSSWLFWLNYDENPRTPGIPKGLSAQIYHSVDNSSMKMIKAIDINSFQALLKANLDVDIPIKLTFLASQGKVIIADPTGATSGWSVDLPGSIGDTGKYVAVRTNGVAVSFTARDLDL